MSAYFSSSSPLAPSRGNRLTPRLAVTCSSWPSSMNGSPSARISFSAMRAASVAPATLHDHHLELVAAHARHGVVVAQRGAQPARDLLQQLVADVVAQRIVDELEAVEVDEQHRHLLVEALRLRQRLGEAIHQHRAVGQAGERVVVRQVLDARLLRLALGDVLDHAGAPHVAARAVAHDVHAHVHVARLVAGRADAELELELGLPRGRPCARARAARSSSCTWREPGAPVGVDRRHRHAPDALERRAHVQRELGAAGR